MIWISSIDDHKPIKIKELDISAIGSIKINELRFSIFADKTRLRILSSLTITDMCVSDISLMLSINQTTVSHQLKNLKMCAIFESILYNITFLHNFVKLM